MQICWKTVLSKKKTVSLYQLISQNKSIWSSQKLYVFKDEWEDMLL